MAAKGQGITRRQALRSSMTAGLAAAVGASARPAAAQTTRRARLDIRNVIFMVADGMSAGVPSMAESFSRQVRSRGTQWYELQQHAQTTRGYFETHSLNSLVTDSSAASTAWGSGSRVFNGAVNMLPDGTPLTPLAALLKTAGRRVGLVTTTTITHATPAGFAAVDKSRGSEAAIAKQYLDAVDVLMGGGIEFFSADRRKDKQDLIKDFQSKGYVYWDHRSHISAAGPPAKILGLFGAGHLPYTIDRNHQDEIATKVPTLAEMTRAALSSLSDAPNGFLLQVEGGRVDHAAHANDAAALLWEQLSFDDAVAVVREFAANHPDTLVVVTTDHGNANPGLRGMGKSYADTDKCFERLAGVSASVGTIQGKLKRAALDSGASRDTARDVIRATCGIDLSETEADVVVAVMKEAKLPYEANHQLANPHGMLGQVLGNHTGVGFIGTNHTEDLAPVLAFGAGHEAFSGLRRNTDAFNRITAAFGIEHQNPSMTAIQARGYLCTAEQTERIHWI